MTLQAVEGNDQERAERVTAREHLDQVALFLGYGVRELGLEDGAWLMALGVIYAAIETAC